MDILQTLEDALLHSDPNKRTAAELQLTEAANTHFGSFLDLLTEALANEEAKTEVRMLAGIGLKNQLTSKDPNAKAAQHARWILLPTDVKAKIKQTALRALRTTDDRVAASAAQLVAAIADIELPRTEWPELIPTIIENTKPDNTVNVKRASHLAIGYICESADPTNEAILAQANGILIAIVQGVQANEPSVVVRLAALNALYLSLEFIKFNFDKEGERNYIMQVVCEATQADSSELQALAFGCLARIMALYYRYMALYMEKALYGLTVSGMKSTDERVSCMSVEFWSLVCEEELEITYRRMELGLLAQELNAYPEYVSFNFALAALQEVLPTLLALLTRQNDDPEDDDWLVAMAAGACLLLFAQNVGNYIVEPTVHFVAANIESSNWRQREAAVMAFGSVLEGPEIEALRGVIGQALAPFLRLIKDEVLQVKETVAWCLGRIADLAAEAIDINTQLPGVLELVVSGLQDHPKVATNCCWTLINLLEKLGAPDRATSVMSPYYATFVPLLVELSGRADNEFSCRALAYEALASFVTFLAVDTMPVVQGIATELLLRLELTIAMQLRVATAEDRGQLEELQTNILALLTNIIRRMSDEVAGALDNLMLNFLKLLAAQEQNSLIEEDIFIAIAAVAGAIGDLFVQYMDLFVPYLVKALQNTDLPTCNTAVGIVADLAQSLGYAIVAPNNYLDGLMNILGSNLNNAEVRKDLRPAILSCFGDVATAVGAQFQPYVEFVMQICVLAMAIEPEELTIDLIQYVLNVRELVLDCFVGIVGGLADQPQIIYPYVGSIFQFLQLVALDIELNLLESVCRSATGLIGDLAAMYPAGDFKQAYLQPWVTDFIKATRANLYFENRTKDAARWAREQQKRQILLG